MELIHLLNLPEMQGCDHSCHRYTHPDTLNLNGVCSQLTSFHALSTERLSRAKTLRRCLLTTLWCVCVLWSRSLLGLVSCAQVGLLDTGSVAELLPLLPLGNSQSAKRWGWDGTILPFTGRHKAPWICSWSFVQMVWGVLLSLPKKMSWGAGPKASEPWHVSRPCWIWIKKIVTW